MLKIGRAFSHQDIQDLAAWMGALPLEKEKNLGILSIVIACGVAADAHVPGSTGERISVTNESHVARRVLTACHYRLFFPPGL